MDPPPLCRLKNLQISPRPSEAYSLLFYDPLGAKHRPGRQDPALAFKPANGKVEKEEIIKWLDGFLSERPDIPQTIDSTASENKNAPPKKKKSSARIGSSTPPSPMPVPLDWPQA